MGSYCTLFIDNNVLWSEKNNFIPGIDILFVEDDKYIRRLSAVECDQYGYEEEIGYRVSLKAARFRLALCGYTLNNVRKKYESWYKTERQYYKLEKMNASYN